MKSSDSNCRIPAKNCPLLQKMATRTAHPPPPPPFVLRKKGSTCALIFVDTGEGYHSENQMNHQEFTETQKDNPQSGKASWKTMGMVTMMSTSMAHGKRQKQVFVSSSFFFPMRHDKNAQSFWNAEVPEILTYLHYDGMISSRKFTPLNLVSFNTWIHQILLKSAEPDRIIDLPPYVHG